MGGLIEPNIHPILVHFAYALTITAIAAYLGARLLSGKARRDGLTHAGDWMLAGGALAILATVAAGFWAYYTVAHDGPSHEAMTTHRNWAVPSALAILALAFWRWRTRAKKVGAGLLAGLMLAGTALTVTAWWGGHIVYNYGLGVKSLPVVTGDGHDHDHGDGGHDSETPLISDPIEGSASPPSGHDNSDGHHNAVPEGHDNSDGHHNTVPEGHDNSDGHHDAPQAAEYGSPAAIVEAYGDALRRGDEAALRALVVPNVIIAEGGGTERSFDEYAGHHMRADMAFTSAVPFRLTARDVIDGSDQASVISAYEIKGNYKGNAVHSRMTETMALIKHESAWRIAHIHWSSSPVKTEQEH